MLQIFHAVKVVSAEIPANIKNDRVVVFEIGIIAVIICRNEPIQMRVKMGIGLSDNRIECSFF